MASTLLTYGVSQYHPASKSLIHYDIRQYVHAYFLNDVTDKIEGGCYSKLKNSNLLSGSQEAEMREGKRAESIRGGADMETHGKDEKASRDKGAGCFVKRLLRDTKGGGRERESDINQ